MTYPKIQFVNFITVREYIKSQYPNTIDNASEIGDHLVGFLTAKFNEEYILVPCVGTPEEMKDPYLVGQIIRNGLESIQDLIDNKRQEIN
jgi:hypothetical protein